MSRIRRKVSRYIPGGEVSTRFQKEADSVLKGYDSLMGRLIADCNAWRVVALVGVGCLVACICLLIHVVRLPKTELVVVSVNDIGEARYDGTTRGISFDRAGLQENVMYDILSKFVISTYTVGTDSQLMYENLRKNFYYLDGVKRREYQDFVNGDDPFSLVGRLTRSVRVENVMAVTDSSWQIDFFVDEYDFIKGPSTVRKRGIFTVRQVPAEQYGTLTDNEKRNNPLAIFITDYNIKDIRND